MPPSREDLEFQRKVEEFAKATAQLLVPNGEAGRVLIAKMYAHVIEENARRKGRAA